MATAEPSAARDYAVVGMIKGVAAVDPPGAFEWALNVEKPELRSEALKVAYRYLQWSAPEEAIETLERAGLADEEKAVLLRLEVDGAR